MTDEANSPESERTGAQTLRQILEKHTSRKEGRILFRVGLTRQIDVGPILDVWVGNAIYEFPLSEEQAARADSLGNLQEILSFLDDLDPGV